MEICSLVYWNIEENRKKKSEQYRGKWRFFPSVTITWLLDECLKMNFQAQVYHKKKMCRIWTFSNLLGHENATIVGNDKSEYPPRFPPLEETLPRGSYKEKVTNEKSRWILSNGIGKKLASLFSCPTYLIYSNHW